METCGSVAYMDPVTGKLTAYITSQAPHAHRTVYALVAGIPEHKIQVISPDIGGGFGNKVPIYPGYVLRRRRLDRHQAAGEVDGGPQLEPDDHRVRPRLPHARRDRRDERRQDRRRAGRRAGRPRRVQRHGPADEVPGRLLPHLHRLLRLRRGALQGHRRVHEQGTGWCGLRVLVPHHRGRVPGRAHRRPAGRRARAWIRPSCA